MARTRKRRPEWIDANADAHGYYRVDYQGGLLAALTGGNSAGLLSAAERVDLIGNLKAMTDAGKIAPADALGIVEVFMRTRSERCRGNGIGRRVSAGHPEP